ncbi:MAG: RNA methyltransferase, partial [Chitinophagaceae bacterium]
QTSTYIINWYNSQSPIAGHLDQSVITVIKSSELNRISFLTTPNEVLGVFRKPQSRIQKSSRLVLMLDSIQDPGNLGTIIRCADWFGITQIICSPGSADNFSPKVVQSSMTSVVRVEVTYTDLVEYLHRHAGAGVYAAALDGKQVHNLAPVQSGILVIGNESKGISAEVMALATERVTIPKIGEAESLNAAVATGILLSHLIGTT